MTIMKIRKDLAAVISGVVLAATGCVEYVSEKNLRNVPERISSEYTLSRGAINVKPDTVVDWIDMDPNNSSYRCETQDDGETLECKGEFSYRILPPHSWTVSSEYLLRDTRNGILEFERR